VLKIVVTRQRSSFICSKLGQVAIELFELRSLTLHSISKKSLIFEILIGTDQIQMIVEQKACSDSMLSEARKIMNQRYFLSV